MDRSIIDPEAFVRTNVLGTCTLLRTAKAWWSQLTAAKAAFRFLHISTDEVFRLFNLAILPLRKRHLTVLIVLIPLRRPPATILSGPSMRRARPLDELRADHGIAVPIPS